MRVLSSISAVVLAVTLLSQAAEAAVVNYLGKSYEVTTKTGTFSNLNSIGITDGSRLQEQVWWGDTGAALFFANAVGLTEGANFFGPPNSYGPFFATGYLGGTIYSGAVYRNVFGAPVEAVSGNYSFPGGAVWAVASEIPAVPLPAGGPLLLAGLFALFQLRSKKPSRSKAAGT